MLKLNFIKPHHSISFILISAVFLSEFVISPNISPTNRYILNRNKLKVSAEDPQIPDILPSFVLGEGPWISDKVPPGEWKKNSQCNPYSGRCSCLQEWGVHLNECKENMTYKPVILEASGWMMDWPYLSGLHRCQRSMCDIRHGHTSDSRTHARLFSVTDAAVEKANANGAIMVVVAMESRTRIPLHGAQEFKYFFDLGVSYHDQLDVQVSYNNYLPKDFTSTGAPFDQKRNSLLFMHSNCGPSHRNELFDKFSQLMSVDALGFCKHNGDVATILPQCAGLSRSGDTFWSENECLLHHFKFYLAIENSRDEDYVTEKLYQGLRSGSVPIYLGAPNVRDFLPHPDSVLLIEDFDSIHALVDYVKRASADEHMYSKHMAWKSEKLPDAFLNQIVTRPMDSIFCRTCDMIATKYGDGVGPFSGGQGDGINIPWCIIRSLTANSGSIITQAQKRLERKVFSQSEINMQTYVLSRKNAEGGLELLSCDQFQVNVVIGYDENKLDDDSISCWHPRSTLESHPQQDFIDLKMLSVSMTHVLALWDLWQKGYLEALIIDDVTTFVPSFYQDISDALKEVPPHWDMIIVDTCSNIRIIEESHRVTQHLFRLPFLSYPVLCAYTILWSYSGAKKLLKSLPLRGELILHVISTSTEGRWSVYWMNPSIQENEKSYTVTDSLCFWNVSYA